MHYVAARCQLLDGRQYAPGETIPLNTALSLGTHRLARRVSAGRIRIEHDASEAEEPPAQPDAKPEWGSVQSRGVERGDSQRRSKRRRP